MYSYIINITLIINKKIGCNSEAVITIYSSSKS